MNKPTEFDKPPAQLPEGIAFANMTGMQKCAYVAKVAICVATFGFAFPHI